MAATFREEYIPPEVAYAHHLQYRLRAPGKVNLNQASLQELQCLPGVDESVGLKLMRLRPLKSFEDFQQLPYTDAKAVQRLIERLRTYVEF
jgi:DNA uptake protein ComE-like DNA-binding protein